METCRRGFDHKLRTRTHSGETRTLKEAWVESQPKKGSIRVVKACRVPPTVRRFYWNTSRAICCPPSLHLRPRGRLCICAIISTHSTEIYTHAAATNKRASELPTAQVQLMSCLYQNVTSVLHTHHCHHHSLDTVTVNTAKGCLSTNSTCKAALQILFSLIHHRRLDNKRKKWPTRGLRRPVANCTESRQKKPDTYR